MRYSRLAVALPLLFLMARAQDPVPRPPDGGNRESVRSLPNGTHITLKNHRAIARDSAERIFQERRLLVRRRQARIDRDSN